MADMTSKSDLPQDVREVFDFQLYNNRKAPPCTRFNACMAVLRKHSIIYRRFIHPDLMMVHPLNRGGLGPNWRKAELVALKCIKVGGGGTS